MATNPLDLYEPDILPTGTVRDAQPAEPHTSGIKAFAKSAALSSAPTAGGIAAVPGGAAAGGGLGLLAGGGTPAEAFTVPAGTIIGGGAAALGMGWVIDKLQTRLIHAAPLSLQQSLGIDDATLAHERAQHPVATFLGSNAPAVLAFRPSWGGWKAALAGGAINSGIQTGQDIASGGGFDPLHSAVAFGIGATFGHNNRIGDFLQKPATWAVERIPTGAGRTQAEQGAADTLSAGLADHGMPAAGDPAQAARTLRAVAGEHLTPDEQAAIHVANDAAVTRETSPFQPGPAGDQEHGLRLGSTLQAILDGKPLPPIGAESAAHAAGRAERYPFVLGQPDPGIAATKAAIAVQESGGSYTKHNPQPGQTASGKYQFTDATWLGKDGKGGFAREVFPGKSDADLMAMKADPAAQEKVMDHALASYGRQLQAAGAPETPGNLYLLHFLGPRGLDVLRADASTPVEALLPPKAIAANRAWLQGKSAGDLVRDMAARTGGELTATVHAERVAADPEAAAQDPALQAFAEGNDAAIAAEAQRREGVAADIAADNAPAKEIATRGPRVRKGPVDVATFLADRGGLADDEGHSLAEGRNLQQTVPGAGKLIRPSGMSVDAAGELLWDHGYFGPPEVTPRPSEAEVLDLIEQTKGGKIYHPEDAMRMADEAEAARAALPPEHNEVRSFLDDKVAEMELYLHPDDIDQAAQDVVGGMPWDRALERAIVGRYGETKLDVEGETGEPFFEGEGDGFTDEPGWPAEDGGEHGPGGQSPGPDHGDAGEGGPGVVEPAGLARLAGEARGDSVALERFDQPAGEGVDAQIESLEHDLRMEIAAADPAAEPGSWAAMDAGRARYQRTIGDLWRLPLDHLVKLEGEALAKERADLAKAVELSGIDVPDNLRSMIEKADQPSYLERAGRKLIDLIEKETGTDLSPELSALLEPKWGDHQDGDLPNAEDVAAIIKAHTAAGDTDEHMLASEIGWSLRDLNRGDLQAVREGEGSITAQAAITTVRLGYEQMLTLGHTSEQMPALIHDAMLRNGVAPATAGELTHILFDMLREDAGPRPPRSAPAMQALPSPPAKALPAPQHFRLDAEGGETTAAEVLELLDADEKAWGELRACLPAKVTE